jgi:hypothetical protein
LLSSLYSRKPSSSSHCLLDKPRFAPLDLRGFLITDGRSLRCDRLRELTRNPVPALAASVSDCSEFRQFSFSPAS